MGRSTMRQNWLQQASCCTREAKQTADLIEQAELTFETFRTFQKVSLEGASLELVGCGLDVAHFHRTLFRIRDAGIAIRHLRGYFSMLQDLEMSWGRHTQEEVVPKKSYFLSWKHARDILQVQKVVLDLLDEAIWSCKNIFTEDFA